MLLYVLDLNVVNAFVFKVIATAALILCILAITDKRNIGAPKGMEPLCIGLIIMAIGVSMGLNCGYPINPARDLGPRFFTAVAGWGMDVFRYFYCLINKNLPVITPEKHMSLQNDKHKTWSLSS